MTQTVQKNQRFTDPELDRREQDRCADLAANPAYARGILEAQRQFAENQIRMLEDELSNLRRVTVDRDRCQATRDSYERTYTRVRQTAERVAGITGKEQRIPAYLPKPSAASEFVTVGAAPFDLGIYRETKGLGPSGKGIETPVPGSGADHGWVDRPEEQGGGGKRSAKR